MRCQTNKKLTDEEEETVVWWINRTIKHGFPPPLDLIRQTADQQSLSIKPRRQTTTAIPLLAVPTGPLDICYINERTLQRLDNREFTEEKLLDIEDKRADEQDKGAEEELVTVLEKRQREEGVEENGGRR